MAKRRSSDNHEQHTNPYNDRHGYKDWKLSDEQRQLSNLITENRMVFVSGKAGCGKTGGILHHFVRDYVNDINKKIIVIRTPVEAGLDKIGALPNGLSDKIEPHFTPAKEILEDLLSVEKVKCDLGKRIKFVIPNFALGMTFKDSLVIISEAQQMPPDIIKLLLERIGNGSKCIIEGDDTQIYASNGKRNGLRHAIGIFFGNDDKCIYSGDIAKFEFSNKVNMRDPIVQAVNDAYSANGM